MSLIKYCDFEFASEKSWAVQKWTGCKWIRMSFECEWSKPPHGARERCVTTTTQTAFGGAFAICFFVGKNNKVTASERTLTANSDVDFANTIFPTWSTNTPSLVALQNKLEVVIPQQMLIIHQWPREFCSIFFSLASNVVKKHQTTIDKYWSCAFADERHSKRKSKWTTVACDYNTFSVSANMNGPNFYANKNHLPFSSGKYVNHLCAARTEQVSNYCDCMRNV